MNLLKNKKVFYSVVVLFGFFILFLIVVTFGGKEEKPEQQDVVVKAIEEKEEPLKQIDTIGYSVEGRSIEEYSFGTGTKEILFVGGMHGGYEWNSVLLAYKFIDYLNENKDFVPDGIKISVIPSLNPDGVYEVLKKEGRFTEEDVPEYEGLVGTGRFNAHDVDLNRNFDCKWQPKSKWRGETVDAGSKSFSEPESQALRDFILKTKPVAVIFWHSKSNAVYASECENGVLPETLDIMNAYADSAGYPAVASFDAYPVTGDAEGWLASIGIPAITVELKTHKTVEWDKNIEGIKALVEHYAKK